MREERGALQFRIETPQPELAREDGALPGGVHDDLRADLLGPGPGAAHPYAHRAAAFEEDVLDGRLLADLGAARRGVPQEQVVELRALDLVGHRVPGSRASAKTTGRVVPLSSFQKNAPYFSMKPAARIFSWTPSRSKIGSEKGRSDSPTWKRGNFSRSTTRTERPARASSVATVEPPGPPPMITAS